MRVLTLPSLLLLAASLGACSRNSAASCGIASLTGPLVAKEAFAKGMSLLAPPDSMPATIPIRLVAGPAFRGVVARDGSGGLVVATEGKVAPKAQPGYGVLIVTFKGVAQGILVYDGVAVPGARSLGTLSIKDTVLPLLGVQLDPRTIENPNCPVFPDSLK